MFSSLPFSSSPLTSLLFLFSALLPDSAAHFIHQSTRKAVPVFIDIDKTGPARTRHTLSLSRAHTPTHAQGPELCNAVDRRGRTALRLAAERGDARMTTTLLAAGADPNM